VSWKGFGGKWLCCNRGAILVFTFNFLSKLVYLGTRLTDVERRKLEA